MLGISYFLGERHKGASTDIPYESGIQPTGSARIRVTAQFYLMAIFFVIFDLEAAFIFTWAVGIRANGWLGYIEILIFIVVLMAALAYLWRQGALDWQPERRQGRRDQTK
ncbi:MAG: NADH-quinone oxidoreductase subunit A [Chloroflexi bacterium]|nr:NADH-quinone oxidoreductase subunit A [Chloroflexota bacterium]